MSLYNSTEHLIVVNRIIFWSSITKLYNCPLKVGVKERVRETEKHELITTSQMFVIIIVF